MKNYDKNSKKGYIFEVDVKYSKKLHGLHSDLPFLTEQTKINKCSKLVCNLYFYVCNLYDKLCCSHKSLTTSIK